MHWKLLPSSKHKAYQTLLSKQTCMAHWIRWSAWTDGWLISSTVMNSGIAPRKHIWNTNGVITNFLLSHRVNIFDDHCAPKTISIVLLGDKPMRVDWWVERWWYSVYGVECWDVGPRQACQASLSNEIKVMIFISMTNAHQKGKTNALVAWCSQQLTE